MNHELAMYPEGKEDMYALLLKQLQSLMEGEESLLPHLCNAAALIYGALKDINWAGFYLLQGDSLLLGPFQGKPACIRIPLGKGVCGTAAAQDCAVIVDDVHLFPGHIACDSASNSEIVIPIHAGGRVAGVLDIDSPSLSRFDERDREGLEKLTEQLAQKGRWDFSCL